MSVTSVQHSAASQNAQLIEAQAKSSTQAQRKPSPADPDGDGDIEAAESSLQQRQESGAAVTFSTLA